MLGLVSARSDHLTRGDVREISDRWPRVLAEVCPNFDGALARRRGAQHLANACVEGRLGLRQLLQALWPDLDEEPSDPTLDAIVYQLDELVDTLPASRAPAGRRGQSWWPSAPTPAEPGDDVAGAIRLVANGDFAAALQLLNQSG